MATAREIAIRYPNLKLAVIEKEDDICKFKCSLIDARILCI